MPELKTQGVDMDLLWQTRLDGLSLQAGATYTDAKYGDDALPDTALALLPGSTASFAPKWALTGGVTYQWDFNASLMGRLHIGAKHSTAYNTGADLSNRKSKRRKTSH